MKFSSRCLEICISYLSMRLIPLTWVALFEYHRPPITVVCAIALRICFIHSLYKKNSKCFFLYECIRQVNSLVYLDIIQKNRSCSIVGCISDTTCFRLRKSDEFISNIKLSSCNIRRVILMLRIECSFQCEWAHFGSIIRFLLPREVLRRLHYFRIVALSAHDKRNLLTIAIVYYVLHRTPQYITHLEFPPVLTGTRQNHNSYFAFSFSHLQSAARCTNVSTAPAP